LADIPNAGIYVFYENDKPLYVGRSNRMKQRILEHGRESSGCYSATFAFNLAKEKLRCKENYRSLTTRKELENAPDFKETYFGERARVAEMKVITIEIHDQILQTLFEVFAHLELKTKYNDFRTH